MKNLILICSTALLLNSCGYMARAVVAPNNCKKCQVLDQSGMEVWVENECGGNVHNMEMRAKVAAYDLGCNHTVVCNSYKQEPTE